MQKTNIFPHNILITFAADVQRSALHIAFQARRSLSCFPNPKYVNKLLGIFRCRDRPKAAANAASHNYYMCIVIHILL